MTKVISLRKRKINSFNIPKKSFKKNEVFVSEIIKVIFLIIAVLSILSGCIFYKSYKIEYLAKICNDFINILLSGTYFEILKTCLKFDILFYIIIFFIGTSFVGMPLTAIPLMIKNIFVGYLSSFIYCDFGLKGILFLLVLFYPMIVITTASHIYSANESIYMSKNLMNVVINKNTADNVSIRLYIIRNIILFGINLITILINSLLLVTIGAKFNLQ